MGPIRLLAWEEPDKNGVTENCFSGSPGVIRATISDPNPWLDDKIASSGAPGIMRQSALHDSNDPSCMDNAIVTNYVV
jgi:hypothetical protein